MELHIEQRPERQLYGVWGPSSQRTQHKDIPAVSKRFLQTLSKKPREVLPFYVVSRGYDEATGDFSLFIGGEEPGAGLTALRLPAGTYARVEIRPKLGFLWGPAIGEAKRFVYAQWLPDAPYRAMNMEYELHTEKSLGLRGSVSLLFHIERENV